MTLRQSSGSGKDQNATHVDGFEVANTQAGHDAAISTYSEDYLGRWPIAHSMYKTIKAAHGGYSTRIGLYGEWGAGKTSLLNLLRDIAVAQGDVVIHVSAWRAAEADSFMTALSREMNAEIKKRNKKISLRFKLQRLVHKLSLGYVSIAEATGQAAGKLDGELSQMITAGAAFTGAIAKSVEQRLSLSSETVEQLRELLKEHQIIVFVDDLDRADPRILPKTLMTLREYLDWPGFAFVLAFDKEIITRSLDDYSAAFSSARQPFLEKIIDVAYDLKVPPKHLSVRMAEQVLEQYCEFIPLNARNAAAQWFPDNPRQIKSIARELSALRQSAVRHAEGELRWEAIIVQTLFRRESEAMVEIVERTMLGKGKPSLGIAFDREKKTEAATLLNNAMSASGCEQGSREYDRLYKLIVKLQGLRSFQDPEHITYEMQLGTHAPCFTQQEIGQLIEKWSADIDDQCLVDALELSAERAFASLLETSLKLLDMTLDQYVICTRQLTIPKVKADRDSSLDMAERIAKFLINLIKQDKIGELVRASGNLEFCSRALEVSIELSKHYNADEALLRVLEGQLVRLTTERCSNKVLLFYRCFRYDGQSGLPELAVIVQHLTADAAVDNALELFTTANGIYLSQMEGEENQRAALLRHKDSLLYSHSHKSKLLDVWSGVDSSEQQSILAKNSLDYLNMLANRMVGFSSFPTEHMDIIEACWGAVTREQWLSSGIGDLESLRYQLRVWGVDLKELPLPETEGKFSNLKDNKFSVR
ncbi:AAA family ATPase [Pseudomonas sp. 43A]|uniref:KAP family P-loop NTPase fold protein n=1 Tax=unclassified Pseudomonas TaxID=196821 RepID=UPI0015871077|nr:MULTISPECIES: P-loop NTPase fold protein [unclassified Pseudomonas]QKV65012.1 AAA family ATPase [Pseudomonas sp. 43A]QMW12534.1 AAA family ATPase [Pseudomonas sp. 29A]